jgi:hypothetical protein
LLTLLLHEGIFHQGTFMGRATAIVRSDVR